MKLAKGPRSYTRDRFTRAPVHPATRVGAQGWSVALGVYNLPSRTLRYLHLNHNRLLVPKRTLSKHYLNPKICSSTSAYLELRKYDSGRFGQEYLWYVGVREDCDD